MSVIKHESPSFNTLASQIDLDWKGWTMFREQLNSSTFFDTNHSAETGFAGNEKKYIKCFVQDVMLKIVDLILKYHPDHLPDQQHRILVDISNYPRYWETKDFAKFLEDIRLQPLVTHLNGGKTEATIMGIDEMRLREN